MALNLIARGPAMFLRFSQPRLATFVKYAKVELTPPGPGDLGAVRYGNIPAPSFGLDSCQISADHSMSLEFSATHFFGKYFSLLILEFHPSCAPRFSTLAPAPPPYFNFLLLSQIVKGSLGLVGDAVTMKWARVTIGQAAVNTVVVAEVGGGRGGIETY